MSAVIAWLQGQRWAIWVAIGLLAIVTVAALVLGLRRSAESAGRALEKLEQEKRVRDAERKMAKVPRPDADELDRRLRDGDF